jgi:hypothetical protein
VVTGPGGSSSGGSFSQRSTGSWRREDSWRKALQSGEGEKGKQMEDHVFRNDVRSPLKLPANKSLEVEVPKKY